LTGAGARGAGGDSPGGEGTASGNGERHARTSAAARTAPTEPLAGWVFAALVLACFAAFVITQRLKHTPTAVQSFKLTPIFAPTPTGHIKAERISFKLARADEVTVTILDSEENEVATLVREEPVTRYKQFSLRWNGREGEARRHTVLQGADGTTIVVPVNTGTPAPAGEYRVKVSLREQHRSVLSPGSFTLVRR
jgi:hypothetical protein